MTVEEKISVLVERYCRNRSHLADMIGVSPQAVNNWVYRDHIPHRGIEAIMARFPQVDRSWLRGGDASVPSGPLPLPAAMDDDDADFAEAFAAGKPEADGGQPGAEADKATSYLVTGVHPSLGDVPQADDEERLVPVLLRSKGPGHVLGHLHHAAALVVQA